MASRSGCAAFAVLLAIISSGCGLIGPICRARQQRKPVTTLTGDVAAGAIVVHRVKYGIAGSQNDLRLTWPQQREAGGPRLRVYLTRVECDQFDPARIPGSRREACASIGGIGSTPSAGGDLVQVSLTVTHGRGNPEQLGETAEYKLWVFGDARQPVSYTIDITSFYGPDC
jgi:hypothetical protein